MAGSHDHILAQRQRLTTKLTNDRRRLEGPWAAEQAKRARARWLGLREQARKAQQIVEEPDEPGTVQPLQLPNGMVALPKGFDLSSLGTGQVVQQAQHKKAGDDQRKLKAEILVKFSSNCAKMAKQCDCGDLAAGAEWFGAAVAFIQLVRMLAQSVSQRKQNRLLQIAREVEERARKAESGG